MSHRSLFRIALPLALLIACINVARAEPATTAHESASDASSRDTATAGAAVDSQTARGAERLNPSPRTVGFDVRLNVAYGAATTSVFDIQVEPYAASFGLETGYTWKRGFRLGAYFSYSLGRKRGQDLDPLIGDPFHTVVDASSLATGISLGYDLRLRFLILRYTLGLGLSWMRWEFSELPPRIVRKFDPGQGTTLGFQVVPGLSLLWPVGPLELGIGFDYLVQTEDRIPPGILSKLSVGVRL